MPAPLSLAHCSRKPMLYSIKSKETKPNNQYVWTSASWDDCHSILFMMVHRKRAGKSSGRSIGGKQTSVKDTTDCNLWRIINDRLVVMVCSQHHSRQREWCQNKGSSNSNPLTCSEPNGMSTSSSSAEPVSPSQPPKTPALHSNISSTCL